MDKSLRGLEGRLCGSDGILFILFVVWVDLSGDEIIQEIV